MLQWINKNGLESQMWKKGSHQLYIWTWFRFSMLFTSGRGGPRNKQETHHPEGVPMGPEEFPASEECWPSCHAHNCSVVAVCSCWSCDITLLSDTQVKIQFSPSPLHTHTQSTLTIGDMRRFSIINLI